MIKYQILRTNIIRIVQQVVRRIAIRILGVKLTGSQMNRTSQNILSKILRCFFVFSCLIFTSHPVHLKRICFP